MAAFKPIKETLRDLTRSANQFHHVPVLEGTHFTRIIYIVDARNASALKAMLAEQAWLAVLVLPGLFAPCIVKAVDENLAAVRLGAELAEQVHLSVHRAPEYRCIPGVAELVDAKVNDHSAFYCKGNDLMLEFVIPELGSERFSEVLQNQDNAFIRLLWL